MARAIIIIEDGDEFQIDIELKFFRNDESEGPDDDSSAHRCAAWAVSEIAKELKG